LNAKKLVGSGVKAAYDPVGGTKDTIAVATRDLKHKKPKIDTTAQDEAMEQAKLAQAKLDEEENRRRKRLFGAASGARAFKGSAMFRARAGNTAGASASASSSSSAAPRVGGAARARKLADL
jgi:hypothetical protein